jgi:hypothetical protein
MVARLGARRERRKSRSSKQISDHDLPPVGPGAAGTLALNLEQNGLRVD